MGAVAIPSAAGTGDVQISTSTPSKLMGWNIAETVAAVATVAIRDGTSTADPIVAEIHLAASDSKTQWFGPQGIICHNGIFLDRLTGTTVVTVFIQ